MTTPNQRQARIRSIPGGTVIGRRAGAGRGDAQLLDAGYLAQQIGAAAPGGPSVLLPISDFYILSNITGSTATPIGNSLDSVLSHGVVSGHFSTAATLPPSSNGWAITTNFDSLFGMDIWNTHNNAVYGQDGWNFRQKLTNSTSCTIGSLFGDATTAEFDLVAGLQTGAFCFTSATEVAFGAADALPCNFYSNNVLRLAADATSSGLRIYGSTSGSAKIDVPAAAGSPTASLTTRTGTIILSPDSAAQGDILYYDGTDWKVLAPGTSGNFLKTQGAGANPVWAASSGSGTVTSVATGTGLTGGPITTTGTIVLADTAVTPGSYTSTNLTVDQQGRITAASNGTAGSGTVTSVDVALPMAVFSASSGAITTSGTITFTFNTQTANLVWAGPSSGSAATPTFRSLVRADLPTRTVTAKTANYSVVAADTETTFTNTGASGTVVFTLPTWSSGLTYTFAVTAAQILEVLCPASNTINIADTATAAAGNIQTAVIGRTVTLTAVATNTWFATSVVGGWDIT